MRNYEIKKGRKSRVIGRETVNVSCRKSVRVKKREIERDRGCVSNSKNVEFSICK